jgi:ankyrin repeat protein
MVLLITMSCHFSEDCALQAAQGDENIVGQLLRANPTHNHVNSASDNGSTALMVASCHGNESVVSLLLANGANRSATMPVRPIVPHSLVYTSSHAEYL